MLLEQYETAYRKEYTYVFGKVGRNEALRAFGLALTVEKI